MRQVSATLCNRMKDQNMLVMRHALRLDEVDSDFVASSTAWWDPPLAEKGFDQVPFGALAKIR